MIENWVSLIAIVIGLLGIITAIFGAIKQDAKNRTRKKEPTDIALSLAASFTAAISALAGIFAGGILVSDEVANFITFNSEQILKALSNPFFIFPACFVGLLLFRIRGRRPALYGLLEICVAITAITVAIRSPEVELLAKLVGIAGGVYILVRGLDNLEKGLPIRFQKSWAKLFPKQKPSTQPSSPPPDC